MNGELQIAYGQLLNLSTLLKQHVKDEEQYLIPPYKKLVQPQPAGGAVRFYQREHRQILIIIDKYITDLKKWLKSPPANIDLVRQFDSYFRFKELLDHHDARERVFLYPILDQKLDGNEKIQILQCFFNRSNYLWLCFMAAELRQAQKVTHRPE